MTEWRSQNKRASVLTLTPLVYLPSLRESKGALLDTSGCTWVLHECGEFYLAFSICAGLSEGGASGHGEAESKQPREQGEGGGLVGVVQSSVAAVSAALASVLHISSPSDTTGTADDSRSPRGEDTSAERTESADDVAHAAPLSPFHLSPGQLAVLSALDVAAASTLHNLKLTLLREAVLQHVAGPEYLRWVCCVYCGGVLV